jgi:hypothetical protein
MILYCENEISLLVIIFLIIFIEKEKNLTSQARDLLYTAAVYGMEFNLMFSVAPYT